MNVFLIALLCLFAVVLGIVNIVIGRKRLLQLRAQGYKLVWYKQLSILVGIEYVLLGFAFLLNNSIANHLLPETLSKTLLPMYLILLLASGILAGVVIFQTVKARRRSQEQLAEAQAAGAVIESSTSVVEHISRPKSTAARQDRRHKSASARRRSGR